MAGLLSLVQVGLLFSSNANQMAAGVLQQKSKPFYPFFLDKKAETNFDFTAVFEKCLQPEYRLMVFTF